MIKRNEMKKNERQKGQDSVFPERERNRKGKRKG